MRRFYLNRNDDINGHSGTGAVAEGVEFSDGTVAMRWRTSTASTALFASTNDLLTIHGHEGASDITWVDDAPSDPADENLDTTMTKGAYATPVAYVDVFRKAAALVRECEVIRQEWDTVPMRPHPLTIDELKKAIEKVTP